MFLTIKSPSARRENQHTQQLQQDRSTTTAPRHDLRMPLPPKQVRLFVGEGLFCQQDVALY